MIKLQVIYNDRLSRRWTFSGNSTTVGKGTHAQSLFLMRPVGHKHAEEWVTAKGYWYLDERTLSDCDLINVPGHIAEAGAA